MNLLFKKLPLLICCIVLTLALLTKCISKPAIEIKDNYGKAFAGSEQCRKCHEQVYETFTHTSHANTSNVAEENTIAGSFANGQNTYAYSFYDVVAMLQTDSGFYQAWYKNGKEERRSKMDAVIGSGRRGQSYISWQQDHFVQLPVSYFRSSGTWVNSPGFSTFRPAFNRPITTRCLECHATYAKDTGHTVSADRIDPNQVIFGVQCERCHGPALEHVQFHEEHPEEKKPQHIMRLATMQRQQQVDLCAYCHGGMRQDDHPAFGYRPGDTMAHTAAENALVANQQLDVHLNQYGLLASSKCYIMTQDLQCGSCHNTHTEQRNQPAVFSAKCLTCHAENSQHFCSMKQLSAATLKANCIDCHMPVKQSDFLTVEEEGKAGATPAVIRSHRIAIYADEAKKYTTLLKSK
ncbi:hypothetical protein I5907_04180 [Panacibacter sp. DH6]|uniref:Cytochrome c-552/4 domain-containing protein n=1 Tax=Panacibacter microcysteis TaxID=2793269 RepID=A0A931GVS9_9BACT|nr:multiheme c-type cytochrome [Panacibacter microcysteis]MBG9375418.1 hypothetical protein [Panacibacter microcysteis]